MLALLGGTLRYHGRYTRAVSAKCTYSASRSIWDLSQVAEEALFEPSSGSMSPDLGDTWRQGMPMNPPWEDDLILDSNDKNENTAEDECEDWSYEELDRVEGEARDYINEVCESSLWAPLCDCLTLADVLVLRTAGLKWCVENLQNHGSSC